MLTAVDKEFIELFCKIYNIVDYKINDDGSIDITQNFNIIADPIVNNKKLPFDKLLVKIRNVVGDVFIKDCSLKSLDNFPDHIKGSLVITELNITSLSGLPNKIDGDFLCTRCSNITEINCNTNRIDGDFHLYDLKKLTSLSGSPKRVMGDYNVISCGIKTTKGITLDCENYKIEDCKKLPKEIKLVKNIKNLGYIIHNQDDYKIWNNDLTLNQYRFNIMLTEKD